MSDDVLFIAVASAGVLFGLWRVAAYRLPSSRMMQLLVTVGIVLVGALALDGIDAVSEGRGFLDHRADLGAGVLLFVVMSVPLWGLFDERVLARVSALGIASIGLAAAYQLADRIGEAGAGIATITSLAAAVAVARSSAGSVRLFGYGWFLAATVGLAIAEADGALGPVTEEIVNVSAGPTFAAFAVLIWLSFHGAFAAKFALIVFTCTRAKGRELAFDFADRMIVPATTPIAVGAVVLGVEVALLASDHIVDWASNDVLVALMVFALPIVERLAAPLVTRPDRG